MRAGRVAGGRQSNQIIKRRAGAWFRLAGAKNWPQKSGKGAPLIAGPVEWICMRVVCVCRDAGGPKHRRQAPRLHSCTLDPMGAVQDAVDALHAARCLFVVRRAACKRVYK